MALESLQLKNENQISILERISFFFFFGSYYCFVSAKRWIIDQVLSVMNLQFLWDHWNFLWIWYFFWICLVFDCS